MVVHSPCLTNRSLSWTTFEPVTCDEIQSITKHKKFYSSPEFDGIPTTFYHYCLESMGHYLLKNCNHSLRVGWILEAWKIGTTNLISKTCQSFPGNIGTLRPIMLLNYARKILETVVARRLMEYCEQKKWVSDR